jgi:cytochrome c553
MADQPPHKPLDVSAFFEYGQSARPLVPGTVARGQLRTDEGFYTGKVGDRLVSALPFPLTSEVLERGRTRFEAFCAPCHDRTGSGQGMVVRRGFRQPPSYHIDRLRQAPLGHFVDVMTNGIGIMPDYAAQVPPQDRWAIAAYIRALQLSQWATLADLPQGERAKLEGVKP